MKIRELKKIRLLNENNGQFLTGNHVDKKAIRSHIKSHAEKNCQPRSLYLEKLSFRNEGEIN